MPLKINKYFTKAYIRELTTGGVSKIAKKLNNFSKRSNNKEVYEKKITYNSIFDDYFTDNQKKEILIGLLSYERAFYINGSIEDVKTEIGDNYKIMNALNKIKCDLKSKGTYTQYSLIKKRPSRLILKSTAQGLLDIIEDSAQCNGIRQVDVINYMFEVYVNIIEYFKQNLDVLNQHIFNIEVDISLDINNLFTIQNMPLVNSVFEVYRDLAIMHEDVNESESYLQLVQIYYYENINNSDFFKKQIYLCCSSFKKLKSYKKTMQFKYFIDPKNINIDFRSMLKPHFYKYFDELEYSLLK